MQALAAKQNLRKTAAPPPPNSQPPPGKENSQNNEKVPTNQVPPSATSENKENEQEEPQWAQRLRDRKKRTMTEEERKQALKEIQASKVTEPATDSKPPEKKIPPPTAPRKTVNFAQPPNKTGEGPPIPQKFSYGVPSSGFNFPVAYYPVIKQTQPTPRPIVQEAPKEQPTSTEVPSAPKINIPAKTSTPTESVELSTSPRKF